MRKTIFLWLLMATGYFGFAQEKTLVQSLLLKPKTGMQPQFETSMKVHNQKFHTGGNKIYVFEIVSGEKTGFFQVAWPATSWAEMDNIKPNPAHSQDVQTTIAPKLEINEGMVFSRRADSLSHGDNDWSISKSQITFWHIKRGKMDQWLARLKKVKTAMDNANDPRNYTIYTKIMAGTDALVMLVSRYKNGWKEMEPGYYTPLKDVITSAYSAEEWNLQQKDYDECVESAETYLRVYRADLSTK
jgi:hypothetical protein